MTTDAGHPGRPLSKARRLAVDPSRNIVLEASAGTGKTTVLVERYLNLLRAGVDPANILAITFTRKAAMEMRERILGTLRRAAGQSDDARRLWRGLRDRLGDVAITTIDAFCLSLLREFPLEADLDPGFGVADETEAPRLMAQALDRTERTLGALAERDESVRLLLTLVSASNLRRGLEQLLQRRLVAAEALRRFFRRDPTDLTPARVTAGALDRVRDLFQGVAGGAEAFVADGPTGHPRFRMLAADLSRLVTLELDGADAARVRSLLDRIGQHLLTQAGTPRQRLPFAAADYPSVAARRRHLGVVRQLGPGFVDLMTRFRRDIGVILARGVRRAHRVAERAYQRTLSTHAVVDFAEIQTRALGLLRRMDEFARSRYRLESRYHHVLVDEFQDTSRAQWELVSLLVQSWGEGVGILQDAPLPPSIFVVGDRKQSIYRFRDADVALFGEAGDYIARLRPEVPVREAISRSFRAVPALLRFVNDLCGSIDKRAGRSDAFRYDGSDRFPLPADPEEEPTEAPLGLALGEDEAACAVAIASEIGRLMTSATVRDPASGVRRTLRPDDVAILFRSRISHREYERALAARGLPTYVYKGLGFFDADEVQDLRALIRFLADPASDFWAAALLRSRLVRLSDPALRALAPKLAEAIAGADAPDEAGELSAADGERLELLRAGMTRWLALVDRVPPAELVDRVLDDSAYVFETRGPRSSQARENLKKMRGLLRRIQNRGYVTLSRIADHVGRLSSGDESNAVIDAAGAVHLMTIHAAKGLEFPVAFVVGLTRGVGGSSPAIQVIADRGDGSPLVTVGSAPHDVSAEERAREAEETKRLLYVALTRARDVLYLGVVRREGHVAPARGSLAEVLPASFVDWIDTIGESSRAADWTPDGESAGPHRVRICAPAALPSTATADRPGEPADRRGPDDDDDFTAWPDGPV
ncbi:MAG: UvrD-helicase domain-containing protein [Vicinamibacterales bacterium]|nr:UvrD-helicase domain-containing protein [Vicinamibacterales bacterium]MDP7471972.1 UvrD-helicase domain-containing protein [Vicinamibacterales bacterium]MDP7671545.1 UvrD-helicase domain-containing protein [Vicinamibacterales bacterium]HJO39476.1 UvrD-helicase domain-containing protein [Vicinamibacterales bacterium]